MTVAVEPVAVPPTGPGRWWADKTPEQRRAIMKKRAAKARRNKKTKYTCDKCGEEFPSGPKLANHMRYKHPKRKAQHDERPQEALDGEVKYLYGKIETLIEFRAHSIGVPFAALAQGVASLLRP